MVGEGPKLNEENLVQFPVPDNFGNMAPKVAKACEFAVKFYDWVVVCDDDTYVVPERLEAALTQGYGYEDYAQDYIGWRREDGGQQYNWPYVQGSCYWLSKRAAQEVAVSSIMRPGIPDDVAVGKVLGLVGIEIISDSRYYPGPVAGNGRPKPTNDIISTHKCLPETMQHIHRAWLTENAL